MQIRQMKWVVTIGKIAKKLAIAVIIIYGIIFVIEKRFPDKFYNCERDTKNLRGGIKIYDGRKYNIVLCGTGGDENFTGDEIRLQVFSEKGSCWRSAGLLLIG